MRTITYRITSLLALAGGFLLSSCIEESTVIKVNRDGSGIIHERSYSGTSDSVDLFPGLSGDQDKADAEKKEPKLPSEESLREYAKTLGTGVTFTSVKASTNKKGWKGYEIVYNFEDINSVRYMRNTPKPDAAEAADPDKEEDKKGDEFTATFAMKDGKLSVKMIREGFQKPAPAPVQTPDSPTIDPYAGTTGPAPTGGSLTSPMMNEEMMKAMTKGMRMGVFLQVDGEIAETNAAHRNGNLITLFNADLGTLLDNKDGMAAVNKMEHFDRTTFQEAADQLDGLDIDLQDPITVEFK